MMMMKRERDLWSSCSLGTRFHPPNFITFDSLCLAELAALTGLTFYFVLIISLLMQRKETSYRDSHRKTEECDEID